MSSTKARFCGQEIIHSNFHPNLRGGKGGKGVLHFRRVPLKRLANDDWVRHVIFDTFIQPRGNILVDTAASWKIWRWRFWSMNLPREKELRLGSRLHEDWLVQLK
ncbi:hypothetical protein TNIN_196391 [Trichonephila inaurata madagascariensis]|uniref:Uncharacterized protein n=1 Tax=Trichonephila inaurata madagascariensis TaxID=2747483 RepID=A0A8X6YDG8_9ARAC|nr:hypothetical protein TNIN_196391 [Trichonephila inaurata madagascariensis]